jgi:hypothetical protein|tara:strand:+ start:12755 stop:14020 length:1266 start_codon:yes stop_codon:yes gene_type:complete
LKTTNSDHGDLLPYNEGGEENAPSTDRGWFLASDIRANEQVALTAMHTLFLREHNYWARSFRETNPAAAEDTVYEYARMIVGAEMQHITYSEFLPILLGPEALPPYRGFKEEADPSITNEFATAAFRFGHSLLPTTIRRVAASGETADSGDLALAEAFFDPSIVETDGIENLLRGMASQTCQELDGKIVDGLRNFLFVPPGSGGLDLASLNIQRGRDHGIPSYNEVRRQLGMKPARRFRDINPDRKVQRALADAYRSVEDVDLWVGGLSEPHVPRAMVGSVFHRIISRQFAMALDKNGNHELSKREIRIAARSLGRLDEDRDGVLSKEELRPEPPEGRRRKKKDNGNNANPPPAPPPSELLSAIDTDGDGSLSKEELKAAPEALLKMDRDDNGKLNHDEAPSLGDPNGDRAGPPGGGPPRR